MDEAALRELLGGIASGGIGVEEAVAALRDLPLRDLGHTALDTQRELRTGVPEVIYAAGKSPGQVAAAFAALAESAPFVLATRCEPAHVAAVRDAVPGARAVPEARAVVLDRRAPRRGGLVVVASAGTSDGPVAEEAALTAQLLGAEVARCVDIGIAGLHRLVASLELLRRAHVIVAVAGMDGALPSAIAGLVRVPVIAVPTSVGYGAAFSGLAPLLTMLNACAPGVAVVNIDNGFGAGYLAGLINAATQRSGEREPLLVEIGVRSRAARRGR